MPIVLPQGRDQLGVLGGPVGAVQALQGTSAQYAIGTNDFIVETVVSFYQNPNGRVARWVEIAGGAIDFYLGYRGDAVGYSFDLRISSIGNFVTAGYGLISTRRWYRVIVFCDRSGNAYWYIDGEPFDTVDISAGVAENIDSTTLSVGGKVVATYATSNITQPRLFVLPGGTFPTDAEMALIANERECNPWAESPTLKRVLGAGYDAARRVDIPFNDDDQDLTTVQNLGTGGNFTIGGGLKFEAVSMRAVPSSQTSPDEDWYRFNAGSYAVNLAANIGCVQGSYIMEVPCYRLLPLPGAGYHFYISAAAGAERIGIDYSGGTIVVFVRTNAVTYLEPLQRDNLMGPFVIHLVTDADANTFIVLINGQIVHTRAAIATDLNLSGNCAIHLGGYLLLLASGQGVYAGRLWNAASLPADWREQIRKRVLNPWRVRDDFSAMTLRANYEMRMDSVQPATSTLIVNRAQLGTGDALISGAGTFGNSTKVAVWGV